MVKGAASAMAADLALGKEQHVAWDRSSILLVKAAKVNLNALNMDDYAPSTNTPKSTTPQLLLTSVSLFFFYLSLLFFFSLSLLFLVIYIHKIGICSVKLAVSILFSGF